MGQTSNPPPDASEAGAQPAAPALPVYPPTMAALYAIATGAELPAERQGGREVDEALSELAPLMAEIRAIATGKPSPDAPSGPHPRGDRPPRGSSPRVRGT